MKIGGEIFRGRVPRMSARALPDGMSQVATSARLLSGDLESWNERALDVTLAKAAPINTIHLMAQRVYSASRYWLQWQPSELAADAVCVDVALGPIAGDTAVATIFTGTALGPRYTNLDLATNEAYRGSAAVGAYPYKSVALGLDAPTVAPTIEPLPNEVPNQVGMTTYDGTDISDWSQQFYGGDGGGNSGWSVGTGYGNPASAFYGRARRTNEMLLYRDFLLDSQQSFSIEFDLMLKPSDTGGNTQIRFLASGQTGAGFYLDGAGNVLYYEGTGSSQNYTGGPVNGTPVHVRIDGSKGDTYFAITVTIKNLAQTATLLTFTGRAQAGGGQIGFGIVNNSGQTDFHASWIDNIVVMTSTPGVAPVPVYANWVYTIVNSLGWESAPSPVSVTAKVDNGTSNKVTIPAQDPTADVAKVRVYRSSTSTAAASYLFDFELTGSFPQTFTDSKGSDALGPDALVTAGFDPPPDNLRGVLALPNGALVGFAGNELCFSEPGYFYAWPIRYRLAVDYPVVGIAAIDTNVIVTTGAFPYVAQGNVPGSYAMGKLEQPQGCVSKRGIAYLANVGVVYPTPDGLYAIRGNSAPVNVTERLFSQREWKALNPSTLIAGSHDNRYFGFYDATSLGGSKGCIVIDFNEDGFGLIDLPDHATAVYSDPITDDLYMVVDDSYSLPTRASNALLRWDRGTTLRPYTWRSKLYQNDYPANFAMAQVMAKDFSNLRMRVYADGVLIFDQTITSKREFVLPDVTHSSTEVEFTGTSAVQTFELAEDVSELT